MNLVRIILILLASTASLQAQSFEISSYQATPIAFQHLLKPNHLISQNDTINELIVDLAEPMLVDSVIEKKKQHHKLGPLGWTISTFAGYNWRAFSMKKEKFVGTVKGGGRSGEERFTEYDINFNIYFHLKKYLHRVFEMYDKQAEIKRQDITKKKSQKKDYTTVPFVRDTNNIDIYRYRLHCELTPQREYRAALNYLFYPTLPGGGGLKEHPNFQTDRPTVGFYGTLCLDCNHTCHPEMHPYEWMWWLKCTDTDTSHTKEWNIGLFHEASNRQKHWSVNPMTGQIRIPFVWKVEEDAIIEIEHGVINHFLEDGLANMQLPANTFHPSKHTQTIELKGKNISKEVEVRAINPINNTQGIQYWFDQINYDEKQGLISGFLYYAVSVQDVYTCQIRFK